MRRPLFIFAVAALVLVAPVARVDAETLNDVQLDAIRTNCVNAQIVLQQIQQNEKPTRINRGYLYESTLKLLENFNTRASTNKIDAPELTTITNEYKESLKTFSTLYTDYDESISTTINIDCRQNPALFHDSLVQTRQKRSDLNKRVRDLDLLLDRYQTSLTSIKQGVAEQ